MQLSRDKEPVDKKLETPTTYIKQQKRQNHFFCVQQSCNNGRHTLHGGRRAHYLGVGCVSVVLLFMVFVGCCWLLLAVVVVVVVVDVVVVVVVVLGLCCLLLAVALLCLLAFGCRRLAVGCGLLAVGCWFVVVVVVVFVVAAAAVSLLVVFVQHMTCNRHAEPSFLLFRVLELPGLEELHAPVQRPGAKAAFGPTFDRHVWVACRTWTAPFHFGLLLTSQRQGLHFRAECQCATTVVPAAPIV